MTNNLAKRRCYVNVKYFFTLQEYNSLRVELNKIAEWVHGGVTEGVQIITPQFKDLFYEQL